MVQQEQQTFGLHEDQQPFIEEIAALLSLAEAVGVAEPLLEELEVFQHEVEHLDARVWESKEVSGLKRNELVGLSLAVLRAYRSRSS
jgi:hypothetical protein